MIKNYIAYSLLLGLTLTVHSMFEQDDPSLKVIQAGTRELYKEINIPGFFRATFGDIGIPVFEKSGRFALEIIADATEKWNPGFALQLHDFALKLTSKEATLIGLSLIPAFYLLYKASNLPSKIGHYLTDYLGDAQRAEILGKTKEQVIAYIDDLKDELTKIQADQDLNEYDRNKIVTTKQQAETLKERINQLDFMSSQKQVLLNQIQNVIDNLDIEQDRASYTLDPRYIGRKIKRIPGQILRAPGQFSRFIKQKAQQYLPSYFGESTTATE